MPESFPLAIKPGWSCWTGCVPHPSRFVPPSLASQDFWSRACLMPRAGRSLIMMSGPTNSLPRPRRRALGTRSARPNAQAGRQLAAQGPPPLDVQRLVDGLVRDPHRFIVGILYPEPMGDLLRAPRCRPMSVLAAAMTSTTPGAHVWARHGRPVLSHHRACEAVLHVAPQPIVRGQLGDLRALGTSGAVPLRSRRPILQTAAPSRSVASVDTSKPAIDRHFKTGHHTCGERDGLRSTAGPPSSRVFDILLAFVVVYVSEDDDGLWSLWAARAPSTAVWETRAPRPHVHPARRSVFHTASRIHRPSATNGPTRMPQERRSRPRPTCTPPLGSRWSGWGPRSRIGPHVRVEFGAPAPRSTLEHVCVVEEPIEERGHRRGVAEKLPPVVHGSV